MNIDNISIIIPAKNESESLARVLPKLVQKMPEAEVVVVDDGSTDSIEAVCDDYNVKIVKHPYCKGNGAAIKSGARTATREIFVFMDADGQHPVEEIKNLISKLEQGYDMVVGERTRQSQANLGRFAANSIYNYLATKVVGHEVRDLTSGFRAVRADKFKQFLYMLPNGFSYPTTITMAFFRSGYSVAYHQFEAPAREGNSHIKPLRDGIRFLLIIFRVATLYSPLKLFFPASMLIFLIGLSYSAYTLIYMDRFTNMSGLLLLSSLSIFFIGLIAEQITILLYKT